MLAQQHGSLKVSTGHQRPHSGPRLGRQWLPRHRAAIGKESRVVLRATSLQPREWIKPEEQKNFCVQQLAFLERKRKFHAGVGPAMPESTVCVGCTGKGTIICLHCKGTGVNASDIEEIMGTSAENVIQQNGVINVLWFFHKGGPCWICRGKPDVPCVPCEGTGIQGFDLANYNGD